MDLYNTVPYTMHNITSNTPNPRNSKICGKKHIKMIMGDSRKYPYHTTDGFKDFRRGGGIHDYGILKAWGGGIYDLKSEGMGEFHRWDFWSRKCRVSSWKTLLLWTFVVRK